VWIITKINSILCQKLNFLKIGVEALSLLALQISGCRRKDLPYLQMNGKCWRIVKLCCIESLINCSQKSLRLMSKRSSGRLLWTIRIWLNCKMSSWKSALPLLHRESLLNINPPTLLPFSVTVFVGGFFIFHYLGIYQKFHLRVLEILHLNIFYRVLSFH